jgi:hypothetical protein
MIHHSTLSSATETCAAGYSSTPFSTTSTVSSGPADAGYDAFLQAAYESSLAPAISISTSGDPSGAFAPDAAADPMLAFDNAYWASQPAAVQVLRTLQNPEQRSAYAERLASQGYKIDVPIMVWGWDPSLVNTMRQSDGYSPAPSADQSPVEIATGFGVLSALAAWNPNNPPAGSIAVSR